MAKEYEDIIHLPHPISARHAAMSNLDRAAQFAPFAALTGYEEETVFYTIYYFPFGTVEMSYRAGEGYNMEKPLTRL